MSASQIRILADDLTGALDTAATFASALPVFIDHPQEQGQPYFDAPISVVATPTLDVAPETLPAFLQPVLGWLQSGTLAFKKIDSLLRGNTFAEIAWIARHGDFNQTIFAPAFPTQGRITIDDPHMRAMRKFPPPSIWRAVVPAIFGSISRPSSESLRSMRQRNWPPRPPG